MANNVPELRSLLGGLSYYRKFLPNLSRRLQPITRLLKKDVPFSFDAEMEAVVREILKVLTKPPVLVYPDFEAARDGSRKFRLYCDASAAGFGSHRKTTRCGRKYTSAVRCYLMSKGGRQSRKKQNVSCGQSNAYGNNTCS